MRLTHLRASAMALCAGFGVPGMAQGGNINWDWCHNFAGEFSPEEQIAGCSAVIQSADDTAENRATAHSNRGTAHADRKDYAAALADYAEALRLHPLSPHAHYNRALTYYALEDYPRAAADLDESIRRDPRDWEAWQMRGKAYWSHGDFAAARTNLNEAVRLADSYSGPTVAGLFSDRAFMALQLREYDAAIADFSVAIQKNIFHTNAYLGRGTAHIAKKNWQFAFEDLSYFLERTADVQSAWIQRCLSRAMLGHARAEVVGDCDRGRDLAPDATSAIAARALIELKYEEWQRAIEMYDAGLARHPGEPQFLYGRGIARARLGQFDEGWADIARATGLDPAVALEFADFGIAP